MKNASIRVTALFIALIVIVVPLSTYCYASDEEIVINDIAITMYAALAGSGIRIQGSQQDVIDWLLDQIDEWVQSQNLWDWDNILNKWQVGTDKLGKWLFGGYTVDIINKFGNWLKMKLGLANNGLYNVVTTGHYVGNYVVYDLPIVITLGRRSHTYEYYIPSNGVYCFWIKDMLSDGYAAPYFFSYQPASVRHVYFNGDEETINETISLGEQQGYYLVRGTPGTSGFPYNDWTINYIMYTRSDYNSIKAAIAAGVETVPGSISVATDIISLPSDDLDYSLGDGGELDLSAPWGSIPEDLVYEVLDLWDEIATGDLPLELITKAIELIANQLQSTSVDNLPAIVSVDQVNNPGFQGVFAPLSSFVTTFSDGMHLIEDVVFHLPTPALAIFYAITSAIVIFGALHMFKEH